MLFVEIRKRLSAELSGRFNEVVTENAIQGFLSNEAIRHPVM